jgi:hypothetical protein
MNLNIYLKRIPLLSVLFCFLLITANAQPANDNCSGAVNISDCPGAAPTAGTTVAATPSFAPYGCYGGQADVWYRHVTGAADNLLNLTVTAGTLGGNVQVGLMVSNCASQNCVCPMLLVNTWCAAGSVSITNYPIAPNTAYFILISGSGATGTFNICMQSYTAPPQPGQDCISATTLCSMTAPVTIPNLQLGDGNIDEQTGTAWSSCILNEQNSQWYQFTCSQSGTFSILVDPATYSAATQTGDDYDFELYDITSSGCTDNATSIACNYSGCTGSTGFSASGAAGWSQVAVTDFQNNNPPGPGDCLGSPSPQWNVQSVSLTAGSTYAFMIQNYTGSTGGVTFTFGGTAVVGPQGSFSASLSGCNLTITNNFPNVPNYNYSWSFGDGTSSTSSAGTITHTYPAAGSYTISMGVSDPLGCVVTAQQIVNCTPLPVELLSLTGNYDETLRQNRIEWSTASELNNEYFTLEYSPDAIQWELVDVIAGGGTTNTLSEYSRLHDSPFDLTYYRLKQTDYDGETKTFDPIVVKTTHNGLGGNYHIALYPNPSTDFITIETDYTQAFKYELTDYSGRTIVNSVAPGKKYTIDIHQLSSGIYFITGYFNGTSKTIKFVKK